MTTATTYTSSELPPERSAAFDAALAAVRGRPGRHRLWIGGEWRDGRGAEFMEHNPAALREPLHTFAGASREDVDDAVAAARASQPAWERTPVDGRVAVLARAAELLEERAAHVAAVLSLEVGKNRLEAIGEVDEVIALIDVYSRQALAGYELELEPAAPGDVHRSVLRPYGVFGVIAPFNFPLALVAGPASAALAAGNTVVVKPAPTTSASALLIAELLDDAKLPAGAFNVVTGGDETGQALVEASLDGIVFTGSHAVGRRIAASFAAGGPHPRPCIAEMGGKNPAVVTGSADLAAAAAGIARSAFGLSGQKCSACSRVLVESSVHDELLDRLVDEASSWTVADPADPGCRLGPVHTEAAFKRFEAVVSEATRDGRVAAGGRALRHGALEDGWFVEPTIVTELPAGHDLTREELFVPVLVLERAGSLQEAIERANDQPYGLTAGLFSGRDDEIELFLDRIEAGTVFVNRASGATSGGWPGQQSYVGWKGSGSSGRGALGPRYVEQFLREQGRTVVRGG
jgi:1-pyrroline-5-carboxylate dehydrogenase